MAKKTYEVMTNEEGIMTFGFSREEPDKIIVMVDRFWGRFEITSPKAMGDLTDFAGILSTCNCAADIEMSLSTSENEIYFLAIVPGEIGIMTSERTIMWKSKYDAVKDVSETVFIP